MIMMMMMMMMSGLIPGFSVFDDLMMMMVMMMLMTTTSGLTPGFSVFDHFHCEAICRSFTVIFVRGKYRKQ